MLAEEDSGGLEVGIRKIPAVRKSLRHYFLKTIRKGGFFVPYGKGCGHLPKAACNIRYTRRCCKPLGKHPQPFPSISVKSLTEFLLR